MRRWASQQRTAVPGTGGKGMPAAVIDLEEMRERNRQRALEIARRNASSAPAAG